MRSRPAHSHEPALAPSVATHPHASSAAAVLALLGTGPDGLTGAEVTARRGRFGANVLPRGRPPSLAVIVLRQFLSPLIYVLLAAAAVSVFIGHLTDAAFIAVVLVLNAVIGAAQEHAAQRSAAALQALVAPAARVVRDGVDREVSAEILVPGDLVRLEGGLRVPADLRITASVGLEADESLLTGESASVAKRAEPPVPPAAAVADRVDMLFAGSLVARGRATGVVVATGARTELGRLASAVLSSAPPKPPLLVRMDRLSRRIAVSMLLVTLLLAAVSASRGMPVSDVFLAAVALAVAAIPEGLPVALTVALSIGARRMARRRVIARRLVAVEALGSCTCIASDKTGTLTLNELAVSEVELPGGLRWEAPRGGEADPAGHSARPALGRIATAVALCNDGYLGERDGELLREGDAVDVALLAFSRRLGISRPEAEAALPRTAELPFEAEHRFSATLHAGAGGPTVFVKGAAERVLAMCSREAGVTGEVELDLLAAEASVQALAERGRRVLAVASGPLALAAGQELVPGALRDLTFLGLVGLVDPLRPGARAAVGACQDAGIEVRIVTGDHPATALSVARELGVASGTGEVVTGAGLAGAVQDGPGAVDALVRAARVFARVDPSQKLEIVRALRRLGHFVAVTGDGANDAPALKAAHIGVAMGRRGTDVARESADLVLADDDFSSIVSGVEEGRVAYANVRKVVFLLVSTGAAEIVLFLLAVATRSPLPLLPVQLLWLNLVTNGIQDVALAFEPSEGGEMRRPPRSPREPVFDRVMLLRTAASALTMGVAAFAAFHVAIGAGWELDRARNGVLLMMVLLENVQAGNSRSETTALLRLSPLRNPLLLVGTLCALALHVAAMHLPAVAGVLHVAPAEATEWVAALLAALALAGVVDLEKALRRRLARRGASPAREPGRHGHAA
ncbi:MAG: HAD-IC family P-type ATPase [Anaeromyxobacter sp.]